MPDLDLRKLRYFVAVAEELNFGRAAERLHLAQPVLSRQIRSFESELGVQLFARSQRGTRLTDAGTHLLDDARSLLSTATALQKHARIAGRSDIRFTVGFMPGIIVTAAVRALAARYPDLTIDVQRTGWDDQVDAIHDGRIDVSYVRLPVPRRGLSVVPLFREPRLVALPASHPLAGRDSVSIAELANLDLLQSPDAVPEWRDAADELRADPLGIRQMGVPRPRTVEEKLEHVAALNGIAILPESTTLFYQRPDVVYRLVHDIGPSEVAIAHEAHRATPIMDAIVEISISIFSTAKSEASVEL
jgi:DNA-binding transcriptional LysR family regulator